MMTGSEIWTDILDFDRIFFFSLFFPGQYSFSSLWLELLVVRRKIINKVLGTPAGRPTVQKGWNLRIQAKSFRGRSGQSFIPYERRDIQGCWRRLGCHGEQGNLLHHGFMAFGGNKAFLPHLGQGADESVSEILIDEQKKYCQKCQGDWHPKQSFPAGSFGLDE